MGTHDKFSGAREDKKKAVKRLEKGAYGNIDCNRIKI